MAAMGKIYDGILNLMAVLAGLILIGLMAATVYKVGIRELTGRGIIGIDQLSGTALVYMTFIGAAWVLRNNGHVTIDLLVGNAKRRSTRMLVVLNSLIGALVCGVGVYFGCASVWSTWERGIMVAAELEMSRTVGLLPIPFGFLLLAIEFLRRAWRAYNGDVGSSADRMEA